MELNQVTKVRRSIRRFKPDSLNAELIFELLEAARLAPSGTNLQPWRFMAVTSPLMRQKLAACTYHMSFVGQAPLTMVCCADLSSLGERGRRIRELAAAGVFDGLDVDKITQTGYRQPNRNDAADLAYLNINVAIAVEHMILRGTELGLGSCWVMMFSKKKVMELLELPETLHVLALVPFGYPDQNPAARPRLSLDDIFLGEV